VVVSDVRLYMRDVNGQIEQAYYSAASNSWNWGPIGSTLSAGATSAPALATPNASVDPGYDSNYPDVYTIGGDGKLYHSYVSNGSWTTWQVLQHTPTMQGAPAALTAGTVYVRDTNGQIEQGYGGSDGNWTWGPISGTLPTGAVSDPVLLVANATVDPGYNSYYPDVYAVGGDGRMYHSYVSGSSWTSWTLVGNATPTFSGGVIAPPPPLPSTRPAVTLPSQGTPNVFTRGTDNYIWESGTQSDGTTNWTRVGNVTVASSPVVYGSLIYARDTNGQITQAWLNGTSYVWGDIYTSALPTGTASASSAPAVVAPNSLNAPNYSGSYPDLIALGGDGNLYHSYVSTTTGTWTSWAKMGTPSAALVGTPILFNDLRLYMRDVNGQIEQGYYSSASNSWNWSTISGNLPAGAMSSPTLATPNTGVDPNFDSNYPDVYAIGGDGKLYHSYVSTTTGWWTTWQVLQHTPTMQGAPAALTAGTVYVRDTNGQIEEGYGGSDGNWTWTQIGGSLPAGGVSDPVLLVANTTVDPNYNSTYPDVYAVGGDGQMYHSYVSTTTGWWTSWALIGNVSESFN
jgi:hypothetical protein